MSGMVEGGWMVWAQFGAAAGGFFWAVVVVVLLLLKWKVPPVLAVAPLGVQAALLVAAGLSADTHLAGGTPGVAASFLAGVVAEVIQSRLAVVSVLPAASLLLAGGALVGARGRKGWGAPILAVLLGFAAAMVPVASMFSGGELPLVAIRTLVYGGATIPLAAALLGSHPQGNAREGSLIAAVSFASIVAGCESLVCGHQWQAGFMALAAAGTSDQGTLVSGLVEELRTAGNLAGIALALASIPAIIALLRPPAELTEEEILSGSVSPSAGRWIGGALALVVPLLWGAAFVATDAASLMTQVAASIKP